MLNVLNRILELKRSRKRLIVFCTDVVLMLVALWASFAVRLSTIYLPHYWGFYVTVSGTAVVTAVLFRSIGFYRTVIRYISGNTLVRLLAGLACSALVLVCFGFVLRVFVPRSVPIIYFALASILIGGSRLLVRGGVELLRDEPRERVLIYGAGATGRQLASALSSSNRFKAVGFVDDAFSKHGTVIHGLRVYSSSQLEKITQLRQVRRVLLALGNAPHSRRREIVKSLESLEVLVQTVPSVTEIVSGAASVSDFRDLDVDDLLGRDEVAPNETLLSAAVGGKTVLVTGAGGSIGSELCRQIIRLKPRFLVLYERSEYALYRVEKELQAIGSAEALDVSLFPLLGSVENRTRVESIMRAFKIETVYHAAAYKHVPMVEYNITEGVRNNVFGTWHAAEAAIASGVKTFVLVSTDKAVRPTNVMGATKRLSELVLQALARCQAGTAFSIVRFGNVLDSSGSVVPLFREQIQNGGPVTVTHPDVCRFFMTIPEAAQLVIQASGLGGSGSVFVLDMGGYVRILDLAKKMIRLMGHRVRNREASGGDVEIIFTGLRPGEKLYEELLVGDRPEGTAHPRITKSQEKHMEWPAVRDLLESLQRACDRFDCEQIALLLKSAPLGFSPAHEISDLVWQQQKGLEESRLAETVGQSKKVTTFRQPRSFR